jgi:predicted ArsR family transcriptional regulator
MSETAGRVAPAWDLAQLLSEPHRREVYRTVRRASGPLTRDEVSRRTGINRRLAAFHLDRLAAAGLLATDYARPEGCPGGPGSGRPAKRYRATDVEVELSVPSRHYFFAARLLAEAISARPGDAMEASYELARAEGKRIGEERRPASGRRARAAVIGALNDLGYEPVEGAEDTVRLRNCPFRAVADLAPELVCGMNCQLVAGVMEGAGLDASGARPGGVAPDCCVVAVMSR